MATSKNINWKVESITLDRNNPFQHPFITAELYTSVVPKTWSPNELAMDLQDHLNKKSVPEIKKVIFNPPATIVLWSDNTKTVVKCQDGDKYDPEHGLAMAIVKKMYGNTGKYCEIFKKWIKEDMRPWCTEKNQKVDPISDVDKLFKQIEKNTKNPFKKAFEDIKKAANASNASVEEVLNSLYGAPKKGTGWIATADRMPDDSGDYLVYEPFTDNTYVYEYTVGNHNDYSYWKNRITYWMPVPAAPINKKGE